MSGPPDLVLAAFHWLEYLGLLGGIGSFVIRRLARIPPRIAWADPPMHIAFAAALGGGLGLLAFDAVLRTYAPNYSFQQFRSLQLLYTKNFGQRWGMNANYWYAMHQTIQLDWFPDGTPTTKSWMQVDWVRVYNLS